MRWKISKICERVGIHRAHHAKRGNGVLVAHHTLPDSMRLSGVTHHSSLYLGGMPCSLLSLRRWDAETLRHWDTKPLSLRLLWCDETLRHWDTETLRHWDTETLRHWDLHSPRLPWCLTLAAPRAHFDCQEKEVTRRVYSCETWCFVRHDVIDLVWLKAWELKRAKSLSILLHGDQK
jgi:hypothetical protein